VIGYILSSWATTREQLFFLRPNNSQQLSLALFLVLLIIKSMRPSTPKYPLDIKFGEISPSRGQK